MSHNILNHTLFSTLVYLYIIIIIIILNKMNTGVKKDPWLFTKNPLFYKEAIDTTHKNVL